jgi:hypothetical protein
MDGAHARSSERRLATTTGRVRPLLNICLQSNHLQPLIIIGATRQYENTCIDVFEVSGHSPLIEVLVDLGRCLVFVIPDFHPSVAQQ